MQCAQKSTHCTLWGGSRRCETGSPDTNFGHKVLCESLLCTGPTVRQDAVTPVLFAYHFFLSMIAVNPVRDMKEFYLPVFEIVAAYLQTLACYWLQLKVIILQGSIAWRPEKHYYNAHKTDSLTHSIWPRARPPKTTARNLKRLHKYICTHIFRYLQIIAAGKLKGMLSDVDCMLHTGGGCKWTAQVVAEARNAVILVAQHTGLVAQHALLVAQQAGCQLFRNCSCQNTRFTRTGLVAHHTELVAQHALLVAQQSCWKEQIYRFWAYLLTTDPTYEILSGRRYLQITDENMIINKWLEFYWRFTFVSCISPMEISCTILYTPSVVSCLHRQIQCWQKRPQATQEYPAFAWFALSAFFHQSIARTLSTRCLYRIKIS